MSSSGGSGGGGLGVGGHGPIQQGTKVITLTGAANLGAVGNLPLLTAAGRVGIRVLGLYFDAVAQGPTGTLDLGVTGNPPDFVIFAAGSVNSSPTGFVDVTSTGIGPGGSALIITSGMVDILLADAAAVIGTVGVVPLTAGTLTLDYEWYPLTTGATLS